MDKIINDFSIPLFLWQLFMLALLIIVLVYAIKLFRRMYRYYGKK